MEEAHILQSTGHIICDSPNEYLDRWDGNITYHTLDGVSSTFNVRYVN